MRSFQNEQLYYFLNPKVQNKTQITVFDGQIRSTLTDYDRSGMTAEKALVTAGLYQKMYRVFLTLSSKSHDGQELPSAMVPLTQSFNDLLEAISLEKAALKKHELALNDAVVHALEEFMIFF